MPLPEVDGQERGSDVQDSSGTPQLRRVLYKSALLGIQAGHLQEADAVSHTQQDKDPSVYVAIALEAGRRAELLRRAVPGCTAR